jgi:hypothetical protein
MWDAGWAGDIAWFQFGAQIKRPDRRGRDRLVGEYALHLSCPWRWSTSSGFVRADETSDRAALHSLGDPTPCFVDAARGPDGVLILRFENGDTLAIDDVGEAPSPEDEVEYWRLLQPGLQAPHLVVTSAGVEWHEA